MNEVTNTSMEAEDIVSQMVEVELDDPQKFSIVKETLTRIGIQSSEKHELYQSCHILHKRGRYYLAHFKQLIALDGYGTNFSDEDYGRLLDISSLLSDWGLVKIIDTENFTPPKRNAFRVLKSVDVEHWTLVPKYTIGKYHRRNGD